MQECKKTAQYVFIDREKPIEAFWKNYDAMKKREENHVEPIVLNYYGFGGIGKTQLLKKIMQEIREKIANPQFIYWDFRISSERCTILERLKNKLQDDYGFKFPLFSLAMYQYMRKTGKQYTEPEVKTLIDSSPFLKAIVNLSGEIPVVGIVPKILLVTDKMVGYGRQWHDKHKRALYKIEGEKDDTPDIIYDALPYSFAKDMAENIASSKAPFVFMFDGYENLINGLASTPVSDDEWIRGGRGHKRECSITANIPNTLWVIAGSEELRWNEVDIYWEKRLKKHLLESFSKKDTFKYLSNVIIREEPEVLVRKDLYDGIYALSNGTPLYLTLCAEIYREIACEGKDPTIEDFGKDQETLMDRFIGAIDDSKKDFLFMLSCMHCWNDELIEEITGEILGHFSPNSYTTIKKLSFIIDDSNWQTMHQTVRNVLYKSCSDKTPSIRAKTEKTLCEYYEKKLIEEKTLSPDYEENLILFSRYTTACTPKNLAVLYCEKFRDRTKMLIKSYRLSTAKELLELFWSKANHLPDSLEKANLAFDYAQVLDEDGRYVEARGLFEYASKQYRTTLGEYHQETLSSMDKVAVIYSKLGLFNDALKLEEEVIRKARKHFSDEDLYILVFLGNLSIIYSCLGRHEDALKQEEKIFIKMRRTLGNTHPETLKSRHNIASTYSVLGRYKEALRIKEETLAESKKVLGEKHYQTLATMDSLACTYFELGRYEEAIKIQEEVITESKNLLGEDHPDTLTSMNNLAFTYSGLGHYNNALKLREEIFEKRQKLLGEEHPETLSSMHNLALSFSDLRRHNDALKLWQKVIGKRRKILGNDHPQIFEAMNNLATTYFDLGNHDVALKLRKEVMTKMRMLHGNNHPDTLSAMHNLAISYFYQGRHEDALILQEEVLAKRRGLLGENHMETLTAMNNLANILSAVNRHEDALELYKTTLEKRRRTLGDNHPHTLETVHSLASYYSNLGHHEEASKLESHFSKHTTTTAKESKQGSK